MVTISKSMSANQIANYHQKDNYHIKDGLTEKGAWGGKTAEALGLEGDVKKEDLIALANGYNPNSLTQEDIKQLSNFNANSSSLHQEAAKLRAELAKENKTFNASDIIKAATENKEQIFKIGDKVQAFDRKMKNGADENVGKIVNIDENGKIKVLFVNNETQKSATVAIDKSYLVNISQANEDADIKKLEQSENIDDRALALALKIKEHNNTQMPDGQLVKNGHDEFGISMHRAGIDMTFSAPKSVSVAAIVGGDKRIIEAHNAATKAGLDYFEKNFAQTRSYDENGQRVKQNTENLAIASYTHYTSRSVEGQAPDPQLHTHNVIFNITKDNEKFKSLSNEEFYKHQKFADQLYQNELAKNIEKLGYQTEWTRQKGGNYTFEIKEMTQANELFSKRDGQIAEHLEKYEKEYGRELTAEEKSILKLETREYKGKEVLSELQENWQQQMKDNNLDIEMMKTNANLTQVQQHITLDLKSSFDLALKNISATESTFNQHQLFNDVTKISAGRFSLDEIKTHFESSIKDLNNLHNLEKNSLDVFEINTSKENSNTKIFATGEMINAERNIIESMQNGKGTQNQIFTNEELNERVKEVENFSKLNEGQAGAVKDLLTSQDLIVGVQGDPGVGKTFLMGVLREVGDDKVLLRGTSKTGKAVDGLQTESLIDSKTLDSFLNTKTEALKSEKPQIWLVDESSMVGTKQLDSLVEKAKEVGNTKIGLVGDTKQLKAVDAGDMFTKLQDKGMATSIVDEILRQKTELTKKVVKDFKTKDTVKDGIERLEEAGKLYEASDVEKDGKTIKDMEALKDKLIENVKADYTNNEKGIKKTTVLVSTNAEKSELNLQLRDTAKEAGSVSDQDFSIQVEEAKKLNDIDKLFAGNYNIGDLLIAQKMQGDIKTGMKTEVINIDKENNKVEVKFTTKSGEERIKSIDAAKLENYQAFELVQKDFSVGDKVMFQKNDKNSGVKNGEIAYITNIGEDGKMEFESKAKGNFEVDINDYKNLDYGYAMTTHKSQGISEDNIHIFAQASGSINLNAGFVQVSRAGKEVQIYTDDSEKLIDKYQNEQVKENAMDHIEADLKEADQKIEYEKDDKSFDEKAEKIEYEKEDIKDKTDQIKKDDKEEENNKKEEKEENDKKDDKKDDDKDKEVEKEDANKSFDSKVNELEKDKEVEKSGEEKEEIKSFDEKVEEKINNKEEKEEAKEEVLEIDIEKEKDKEVEIEEAKEEVLEIEKEKNI